MPLVLLSLSSSYLALPIAFLLCCYHCPPFNLRSLLHFCCVAGVVILLTCTPNCIFVVYFSYPIVISSDILLYIPLLCHTNSIKLPSLRLSLQFIAEITLNRTFKMGLRKNAIVSVENLCIIIIWDVSLLESHTKRTENASNLVGSFQYVNIGSNSYIG